MTSPTEEIKARLDIVDVIGAYATLKRAGTNLKANCPFHSEKTPSFMVSQSKQLWYCFGACHEGGDIFKFVMKIEGLEFPDALRLLADKAGITLPKYDKRLESRKNILLNILKFAQEFYSEQLQNVEEKSALSYLKNRGLTDQIIARFGLGYAPDAWDSLVVALRDKYSAQDVFDAGLIIKKQRAQEVTAQDDLRSVERAKWNNYYDRFRHRLMFPIRDIHGTVVGFTSRLLDEKRQEGKYINTPETLAYNKGRVLYGLDFARESIRSTDHAVLVEGNMDVIACHQFGMTNVAATSGTALTAEQIRLLKRYTNNLKIAFDADPAGEKAALRGIEVARAAGMQIKVITIPNTCGKDPDECIRRNRQDWEQAVRGAKEIMEYFFEKARSSFDISNAHGLSQFVNALLKQIVVIPDLVEQDFWIKKLAQQANVEEGILREQLNRIKNEELRIKNISGHSRSISTKVEPRPITARSRLDLLSQRLLAIFLYAPKLGGQIISQVLPKILSPASNQGLYNSLVTCYNAYNSTGSHFEGANFRQFWRKWAQKRALENLSTADMLELYGDREFEHSADNELLDELNFLVREIRQEYTKGRRKYIAGEMRKAEEMRDDARVQALTREFQALTI